MSIEDFGPVASLFGLATGLAMPFLPESVKPWSLWAAALCVYAAPVILFWESIELLPYMSLVVFLAPLVGGLGWYTFQYRPAALEAEREKQVVAEREKQVAEREKQVAEREKLRRDLRFRDIGLLIYNYYSGLLDEENRTKCFDQIYDHAKSIWENSTQDEQSSGRSLPNAWNNISSLRERNVIPTPWSKQLYQPIKDFADLVDLGVAVVYASSAASPAGTPFRLG